MSLDVAPLPLPSASTISATATAGVHVIKLSGYSHAKQLLGTGECVESAKFKAAGRSWRVKVYPNGSRDEECGPGSMALYLVLVGASRHDVVRAGFQFGLLPHGSKLTSASNGGRTTAAPVTFNADMQAWGFEDFGTMVELEKPEYVKDDAILIRCDVTVLKDPAVERRDLGTLGLLCDCDDGLCKNLHNHGGGNRKNKAASQSHFDMVQETPMTTPLPSASTIAVTARTGCHVVKVSGYSQTKLLPGNGNGIESARFEEAGHTWRIWCYPDGDREETAGHISLYLELAGRSTDVHAEYQFSLVPHGQLTRAAHGGIIDKDRRTFKSRCMMYLDSYFGFMDFMAREELEKSEYLKDDCFYIRCDIAAMNKPVVKLHDPETLELLCYCNDDLCKNIHARGKMEAEAYGKPRRCLG